MATPTNFDPLRQLQQALAKQQTVAYKPVSTPARLRDPELYNADLELVETQKNAIKRILKDPKASGNEDVLIAGLKSAAAGKEDEDEGLFGAVGDIVGKVAGGAAYVLNRPLAVVASTGKEISDIASGQASFEDWFSQALAKDTTVSKYLPKTGNRWIDGAIGFVGDVVADPLTWVTFGAAAAGRANRLALAAKAGEAANLAKMPSLAAKVADGRIAKLGEWALTNAEREVLGVPKTLSWQFGGKAIGTQGRLSGDISAGLANLGKPFTVARAKVGESKLVRPLQELTAPKSVKAAGLTFYGRGKETPDVINRLRDLASYSASIRGNAVRQTVSRELGSRATALTDEITKFEASSGLKIHEVLEQQRTASSPIEANLVTRTRKFLDEARQYANDKTQEFSGRRKVVGYDIAHRENYVPHALTKEARDFIAKGEWGRSANQIGAMLGISKTEFKKGSAPLFGRTLKTGDTFLGRPLSSNTGDNAVAISEINRISNELLKFKWFEDDGASYIKNYVDSIATQSSRVAFSDRLFDYGPDVVQSLTRITPDKSVVKQWKIINKLVDNISAPILKDINVGAKETGNILTRRVRMAQALLDSRPGAKLLTPEQVTGVQRQLRKIVNQIKEADGIIGLSRNDDVRAAYETVMTPIRARMEAINSAIVDGNDEELVALTTLTDLYQRLFPEANGIPSDPRILAEDIVDAATAMSSTPMGIELGVPKLVDDLQARVTGAVEGIEGNRVFQGESADELARLEMQLMRPDVATEILPGASRELRTQSRAVPAREAVERIPGEIADIASRRAEGLADVAGRQAEAEGIIQQQREMFGADTGISGRAVPLPQARQAAQNWVERRGGVYTPPPDTQMANPARTRQIAEAYKKLPEGRPPMDTPAGREAHASYKALIRDVEEQYDYLTNELGVKIEFVDGDPYPNPAEMFIDIQNNNRLKIWKGESDNPMLTHEQNLKFRAVHDYFGHASRGTRFDRNGEEGAFLHHLQMFSPEARGAAASELRGQNSYLIAFGEFGPQKGYLLPKKYWGPEPRVNDSLDSLMRFGGYTVDLAGREARPTSGYQVAMGGSLEKSMPAVEFNTWSDVVDKLFAPFFADAEIAKALNRKGLFFGTYYSDDSDKLYVEVSRNYATMDEAYKEAVARRQESILDWEAFDSGQGKSELFLLELMDDKIAKGKPLSAEELETKKYLEKQKAIKQANKRATQKGLSGYIERGVGRYREALGGTPAGVRTGYATTESGASGTQRLAGLPKTARTVDEVTQILNDGTARLRELGYVTDTPGKINPLEAQARGIKATATRQTNKLQAELEEAQALVDAAKPIGMAQQEWDAGIGRIYKDTITQVLDASRARPPKGSAGASTAQWVQGTARMLTNINAPGLDLLPVERELMEKLIVSMKGMEAHIAMWESTKDFTAQQLAKARSGELGGQMSRKVIKGWEAIESLGIQMPPELRDRLFARVKELETPQGMGEFMKLYERYNRFFKVTAMLSPGFIVRNSYTAAFNNFVAGVSLKETGDGLAFATKMWKDGLDAALKSVPESKRALYRQAVEVTFATGAGQTTDDIVAPALANGAKWLNKRPVSTWSKANEATEVGFRMGLALSSLNKGMDFDRAVGTVSRFHFDYSDLSKLDEVARKFIPFWIFASRNIPLQITNQIARPSMYRAYEKLQENYPTEEGMIMPPWLARRNPIGLGGNAVLNLDLPQVDMAEQISMFTDPARLLSQFNPLLKLPMELSGGRQYATNTPFKDKPVPLTGPTDIPAWLAGLIRGGSGRTQDGQFYTSDKAQYAVTNLLPTLGQLQRLLPELGGKEAYKDRATSSRFAYFGLPYRRVSPQEQTNELTRRQFLIRDYLSKRTQQGFLTPTDQQ